jgi:hypothetical protein
LKTFGKYLIGVFPDPLWNRPNGKTPLFIWAQWGLNNIFKLFRITDIEGEGRAPSLFYDRQEKDRGSLGNQIEENF